MVDEKTISLNYIKKLELPGSDAGIRYMFRAEERSAEGGQEGEKTKVLCCYIWPEPLGFGATDPKLIQSKDFPLTEEGKVSAVSWINEEKMHSAFLTKIPQN